MSILDLFCSVDAFWWRDETVEQEGMRHYRAVAKHGEPTMHDLQYPIG